MGRSWGRSRHCYAWGMHLEVENSTCLGESQPYNELWAGQGSANPMFNAQIHTVTLGTPKKVPGDAAKQK